ncbi:MAG: ABC transporter permease [Bacilli bacterium]|nr:ABC transporter permease [Bacilli bacterium]
MFGHIFINRLKILIRNKSAIFWTLVFPLILATLFNIAFSNLTSGENFKVIKLAVVNNENFKNEGNFKSLIESLSEDSEEQLFNTVYLSESEAKILLQDDEISGYIIVNEKIDIVIKNNGINQSTIKSVVDNYYQVVSVINNIAESNPEAIRNGVLDKLNENTSNFNDISNENVDDIVVYFYTLIGMICLYGGTFGVNAVIESEANLSKKGARVSVSPVHKFKLLFASFSASIVIHYSEVLILLAYLMFVLKINLGNQVLPVLLITFVGSLAGTSLGTLIGVSNKKSENMKMSILISTTMIFSFLSGMMVMKIKYIIANNIPILARINPVNYITDGLYSLYYYNTLDRFYLNVFGLIMFTLIMFLISYVFIRRKKYDSI